METATITSSSTLNSNVEPVNLLECLRMIGIQEISANIFSIPNSKKQKQSKEPANN